MRTGQLTASAIKRTFKCKLGNPSKSYLKQICYPYDNKFISSATTWRNKHEDTALAEYKHLKSDNKNFSVQKCCLIIRRERTYIAASPDALVSYDCLGNGLCEIKVRNSIFSFMFSWFLCKLGISAIHWLLNRLIIHLLGKLIELFFFYFRDYC